ncbi:MAG: DUF2252 domain-containing protein [Acidobacteria bacterium]|nr:MAG: DUF2252 domain-containing protein [Acidobacteriota bacterium]
MEPPLKSLSKRIPNTEELRRYGRGLREVVSRSAQGEWNGKRRFDPLDLIVASNRGRVPRLVPIKMARMAASPFGFFRGAVPLMAADLARLPASGLTTQICGDAHVRNVGAYAAPGGALVFDINDFDETIRAPWEWDVKRMAASVVLAGREAGNSEERCKDAVYWFIQSYRGTIAKLSNMTFVDLERFHVTRHLRLAPIAGVLQKARRETSLETLEKYARHAKNGVPVFAESKPLLMHLPRRVVRQVLAALETYRETLSSERKVLLDRYSPVDIAFKVVGTGSVGTRDYVVLLLGNGLKDPLFLQIKEEPPSAYVRYVKEVENFLNEGRRVVEGQRRMQTQCDPLLGWTAIEGRDYLVRQLCDHKAGIEMEELKGQGLIDYARVCGELLAKGHARAGSPAAIAGYLGSSNKIDKAIAKFAFSYADQTSRDHAQLRTAIKAGKIQAAKEQ